MMPVIQSFTSRPACSGLDMIQTRMAITIIQPTIFAINRLTSSVGGNVSSLRLPSLAEVTHASPRVLTWGHVPVQLSCWWIP